MRNFLTWCSKYISISSILILGLIVYILFIQDYSVGRIYENDRTIDSLNKAIAKEQDSIIFYQDKNDKLDNNDPEIVERIVREQFNMSKANEEVFLVN